MPRYDFLNSNTGEIEEHTMSYKVLDEFKENNPHLKFSKYISKLKNNSYLITSEIMNWSNLAIIVDRNFFLNVIIKEAEITNGKKKINGFKNIEIELNKQWWRDKKWNLIITNGLFKHLRVDYRGY